MHVPELQALITKVEPLKDIPTTFEIYAFVHKEVQEANTPAMAQSVCSKIITMCHPRAWGDMYVEGVGESWNDWQQFLSELSETANQCGQLLYEHHSSERDEKI